MVQAYTLYTSQIDDMDAALAEIGAQVQALPLLANSVGILVCHYDYIGNGTIEALNGALPFPVVGITSFYQVTPKCRGMYELTITVLTSDDVRFALSSSAEVGPCAEPAGAIKAAYEKAQGQCGEEPALIISFLSMMRSFSGDEYLRQMDACSGGALAFGAVAAGNAEAGDNLVVVCKGDVIAEGFAMLLLAGDVQVTCGFGNGKEEKLLETAAQVTKASGARLEELNGQSAVDFLRKNGFDLHESEMDTISNIPLYYKCKGDGGYTARTMAGFDERGALKLLGEVPQGALLRVGTVSSEDVVSVSIETMKRMLEQVPKPSALLIFSCIGRYITLGMDPTSEMEGIAKVIPGEVPFIANYVGGEICPVLHGGAPANRYHNASFVVCALS